ncbi:hypothetical protein Tco_0481268 [Tanacetum coccineum]
MMDDPNIIMEEYIKHQAKKAQRRGRVFNWETATYGKVNDSVEINTELRLENIDIKPMDSLVCISNDTTPIESDEHLETNHDEKRELSEMMSDTEMGLDIANIMCFQLGGARRSMSRPNNGGNLGMQNNDQS